MPEQIRLRGQAYRFERHMEEAFNVTPDLDWLERANDSKAPLRTLLGLDHPNSALLLPVTGGCGDYEPQISGLILATEVERMIATTGSEAVALHGCTIYGYKEDGQPRQVVQVSEIDLDTLGYKVGKQQAKLSRRMAALPVPVLQLMASRLRRDALATYVPEGAKDRVISEIIRMLKEGIAEPRLTYVLTTDPVAILRCSSFACTSSSCHRPGGEYQFGPFGYAQDPWTVMALAVDPTCTDFGKDITGGGHYVKGRMLFHFPDPDNVPAFVQARQYGNVPDTAPKTIRTYIQGRLRAVFDLPPGEAWKIVGNDMMQVERAGFCYVDRDYLRGYYLTAAGRQGLMGAFNWEGLSIECPNCGRVGDTSLSHPFVCGCFEGEDQTCTDCGCRVDLDTEGYMDDAGYLYCDNCNPYSSCYACGEMFVHDYMTYIERTGESYCDSCRDSRFTCCEACDEWIPNDRAFTVNIPDQRRTWKWCEECIQTRHCGECAECGEMWTEAGLTEAPDGERYCPDCIDDYRHTCESCGAEIPEPGLCAECATEPAGETDDGDVKI